MDLKTFVSESLTQILDGIRDAQARPGGDDVAADGYISSQGHIMAGGTSGFFTSVEFDVSIAAESKDGGNVVKVADASFQDGAERKNANLSRVRFSVHLRIPKGGDNRAPRQNRMRPQSSREDDFLDNGGW